MRGQATTKASSERLTRGATGFGQHAIATRPPVLGAILLSAFAAIGVSTFVWLIPGWRLEIALVGMPLLLALVLWIVLLGTQQ